MVNVNEHRNMKSYDSSSFIESHMSNSFIESHMAWLECSYCKRRFRGLCYLVCPECQESRENRAADLSSRSAGLAKPRSADDDFVMIIPVVTSDPWEGA